MTNAKLHASTADILAILAARRTATLTTPPIAQAVPTVITPQSLAVPMAVPAHAVQAPTPTVSDDELTAFLGNTLPDLIQATTDLVTPPFQWSEVTKLGEVVSKAVAAGLPKVKGAEARTLVVVLVRYLWRAYAITLLPPLAKPFAPLLESLIVSAIEAAYQLAVKH